MVQETKYSPASGTEVGEKSTSYVKETGWEKCLKLGTGSFVTNGKTTVTIKATGYKDLVISYGTDATPPTEPGSPEIKTAPKGNIEHKEADNYYQVSFKDDNVSDYLKAITSVKVGNIDYKVTTDFTPTGKQYSFGSTILPSLKLGADGFTGSGDITVTITATGYTDNVVTYTMPNSGDSGGSDSGTAEGKEAPTPASVAYTAGTFSNSYDMIFANDAGEIDPFFKAIEEITVNGETYTVASSSFSFGDTNYILRAADKKIELGTKHFSASGETKIVIKAKGYKPLEFTYNAQ